MDQKLIKEKIKYFRQKNQLTQHSMAILMNITQSYYQKLEAGDSYIQLVDFIKICDIFKVSMDELINYDIHTSTNFYFNTYPTTKTNSPKKSNDSDREALYKMYKYIKEQEIIIQALISNSRI